MRFGASTPTFPTFTAPALTDVLGLKQTVSPFTGDVPSALEDVASGLKRGGGIQARKNPNRPSRTRYTGMKLGSMRRGRRFAGGVGTLEEQHHYAGRWPPRR